LKGAVAGLDQDKARQYLQTPVGSVQGTKLQSISNSIASLEAQPQTKDVVAQKQELVKQQLEIIQTIKSGMETPAATPVAKATPSTPPPGGSAGSSSSSGSSMASGGGGSTDSSGGMEPSASSTSATPVATPPPTTGADIGNASVAVSAASEPSSASSSQVVNNSSAPDNSSSALPIVLSPIADRGSLDFGVTFKARGGGD
jgi:hypothetical protein